MERFGINLPWLFAYALNCILLLAILGGLVFVIVRVANAKPPANTQTPLDVLKARYARGELTKEQFEAIKQDLA